MPFLRGVDRGQDQVLPASVEDYVGAGAPVRLVDAFVDGLDLGKAGFKDQAEDTGRSGFHPADLIKLYLMGYLNRVRSSRRLEAEAQRNLEVIWLMRGVRPDYKTIADFRRDYGQGFKAIFREFNLLCRKLDLFGSELVAIDGAKFKAVNSNKRHWSTVELQELVRQIDAKIERYLTDLKSEDEAMAHEPARPTAAELKAKIDTLKTRRDRYRAPTPITRWINWKNANRTK